MPKYLEKLLRTNALVIDFQHARRISAIGQAVIDLVYHQMAVPGLEGAG